MFTLTMLLKVVLEMYQMKSQKKITAKMKEESEILTSVYEQLNEDTDDLLDYFNQNIERNTQKNQLNQEQTIPNNTSTKHPTMDVTSNYKDNLLASLYSQLEFLRNEIVEKNEVIRKCFQEERSKDPAVEYKNKYQENLTASLYAQIEFLRKELDEKNGIIKILLRNASLHHLPEPDLNMVMAESLPYEYLNFLSDDSGVAHSDATSGTSTKYESSEDGYTDDGLFNVYDNKVKRPITNNIHVLSSQIEKNSEKKIKVCSPSSTPSPDTCDDQSLTWRHLDRAWESGSTPAEKGEDIWEPGTHLIIGDDTILGMDEQQFGRRVKVRGYSGARLNDFYDYLEPLLTKRPSYVTIMTCTDDLKEKCAKQIVDQLLGLKAFVEQKIPGCRVKISCAKSRFDDDRTKLLTLELRQLLTNLNILQ